MNITTVTPVHCLTQFQYNVPDIFDNAIQDATVCQELFSCGKCKEWRGDLSAVTASPAATASDKRTDILFSITQVSRDFKLNSISSMEERYNSSTETNWVWTVIERGLLKRNYISCSEICLFCWFDFFFHPLQSSPTVLEHKFHTIVIKIYFFFASSTIINISEAKPSLSFFYYWALKLLGGGGLGYVMYSSKAVRFER